MHCLRHILVSAFWVILAPLAAIAQEAYFRVDTISHKKTLHFPLLSATAYPQVADRINTHLQLSELALLRGYEKDHLFEEVVKNEGLYGGKVDVDFEVLANTPKLFSVYFSEAGCGITCAYWTRYYNFNAGNGDLVQLSDLFGKESYPAFRKLVLRKRASDFRRQTAAMDSAAAAELDYVPEALERDDLSDYYIKGSTLYIDGFNLLSKHDKMSDLEMKVSFRLAEFSSLLNAYGKALFYPSPKEVAAFRSQSLPQVFRGTVGQQPVLFIIRRGYEDYYDGVYAYRKWGRGIDLEGKREGTTIVLEERDDELEPTGFLRLQLAGQKLTGSWCDKTKTRSLPVQASRY